MTAWHYATIAFQPYPDVGEFVNIGALALAVPARVLAYRLLPAQTTGRIHGFFPELDLAIYKEGRKRLEGELQRLEMAVNSAKGDDKLITPGHAQSALALDSGDASTLFKALTAPRDGLFRFHDKGTRLAEDASSLLDSLFDRYVARLTAETEDPEEQRLVHEMDVLLREWKVRGYYRRDVRVGPESFLVKFPFGYQPDESVAPQRVIKPLNLAQPTSTQVYHHGDMWVANFKRLTRLNALPPHVLLPVKMPLATRGASRNVITAAEEIAGQLREFHITLKGTEDRQALRAFAEVTADHQESLVLKA